MMYICSVIIDFVCKYTNNVLYKQTILMFLYKKLTNFVSMDKILTPLCILSLIISVVTYISVFSVSNGYCANMSAFIISILTLLVTTMIGWQIYNAIEINKKVDNIYKVAERAAYNENKTYNHTTLAVVHYINAIDYYKRQNISEETVDGLFHCIEEALKGKFQFPIDLAMDYLLNIPQENFHVHKEKREFYMKILYNLNNDKVETLITKIQNAL